MDFLIAEIKLDFQDCDGELSLNDQKEITESIIGEIWSADNEEDLIEEITCAFGWCVKSIDFCQVSKSF
jgi:hypothetical protein